MDSASRRRSVIECTCSPSWIQPTDVLEDGRQNMCDGCADMTLHEGRLAWSCRLEELRRFGTFVTSVPKRTGTAPGAAE